MSNKSFLLPHFFLLLTATFISSCAPFKKLHYNRHREIALSESIPEIDKTRDAKILTAFFGLDNSLPKLSRFLYKHAPGKDGMPVVFSHELDPTSVDTSDFEVVTKNGSIFKIEAISFVPAEEEFELRSLLLIGEYGNHPDNPPIEFRVVGDLLTRTGANYKGQSKEIIPLLEGPVLSYAEYFTIGDDYPYVAKGPGCDCPQEQTNVVIKMVWSGGVRALNGKELGNQELERITVTMAHKGDTNRVHPFMLADLGDNDNNIDLCLDRDGIPLNVEVHENIALDPNDDPNPNTSVRVVSRW